MSDLSPLRLNTLYANSRNLFSGESKIILDVYKSIEGEKLNKDLRTIFAEIGTLDSPLFDDLRMSLAVTHTYLRCLVLENSLEGFWQEQIEKIKSNIFEVSNFIESATRNNLEELVVSLEVNAAQLTSKHTERILTTLSSAEGPALIFPETPKLGHLLQKCIDQWDSKANCKVLLNKGEIADLAHFNFKKILFPGSPTKYLRRKGYETYFRSTLLAGYFEEIEFIFPDWSHFREDLKFTETLFRGMEITHVPPIRAEYEEAMLERSFTELTDDLDDAFVEHVEGNYENLERDGSIPCRLIHLTDELSYPVEDDAAGISILKYTREGEWEVSRKNPFTELQVGDLILACVGKSEETSLRERAALEMGTAFQSFEIKQNAWKNLLNEVLSKLGNSELTRNLSEVGVLKPHRAKFWTLPTAIQPQSASDFVRLLSFLGFDAREVQEIVSLAAAYDRALIASGRQAGRDVASAMDESNLKDLDSGKIVIISLEHFGGAQYMVAPVREIGKEELLCRPSQVRQVVSLSRE